jgi:uncharacterized protein YjlB
MSLVESIRRTFERVTGVGVPSDAEVRRTLHHRKPRTVRFRDDGSVPNNQRLPFVHYRSPVWLPDGADPAAIFERLFESNGWGGTWRNGIYDFIHYHPATHEVLGIARGEARVRFGGRRGRVFELRAGDVAILPAGTGHQRVAASPDLLVVGAYPATGHYDEYRGTRDEHARALRMIPKVPLPERDPVYGPGGPLIKLWRRVG